MTGHVKVDGAWKSVAGVHAKIGGAWAEIQSGHTKVDGAWKQFYSATPPAAYELIETTILGSAASSVTFSSLDTYASTYKHLQIRAVARTAQTGAARAMAVRLNGDTGTNYSWHLLQGNGSTVTSTAGATQSNMYLGYIGAADAASNIFGASVIDILDPYSTTKNTTARGLAGNQGGSTPPIGLFSSAFYNTSSITSISLFGEDLSSDFVIGSRFSLYGSRG